MPHYTPVFANIFCREFCQFAIPSLSFVYLFMCTFFLAALAIDQRRVDAGRFWLTKIIHSPLLHVLTINWFRHWLCCCSKFDQSKKGCSAMLHRLTTLFLAQYILCGFLYRPQWLTLSFYGRHLGKLLATWPARFLLKLALTRSNLASEGSFSWPAPSAS